MSNSRPSVTSSGGWIRAGRSATRGSSGTCSEADAPRQRALTQLTRTGPGRNDRASRSVPAGGGPMTHRCLRRRTRISLVAAVAILGGVLSAGPAQASPRPGAADQRVDVYAGELSSAQLQTL